METIIWVVGGIAAALVAHLLVYLGIRSSRRRGLRTPAEAAEGAHARKPGNLSDETEVAHNRLEPAPAAGGEPDEEVSGQHSLQEQEEAADAAPGDAPARVDPLQFTVRYPREVLPGEWATLLAYGHLASAARAVLQDAQRRIDDPGFFAEAAALPEQPIQPGAKVTVVPEIPGCRFNPPQASFEWLEDWHVLEFRFRPEPEHEIGVIVGRVAFYVLPILVAEVPVTTHITGRLAGGPKADCTVDPYESIFVSYSHRDTRIVELLEKAYTVLGFRYLRDVSALRSGEEWDPALLKLIELADIFQLCWSHSARSSMYVEREWKHALELGRQYFLRPVFWERPMPERPLELRRIQFSYLDLEDYPRVQAES